MFTTVLVFGALLAIWYFFKGRFTYWSLRGVPTLPSHNPIFGDITNALLCRENLAVSLDKAHKVFQSQGHKFGGIYIMNNPILMIVHPELLRASLIADFSNFTDRGVSCDTKKYPLSGMMFSLKGEEWRYMRQKTTVMFTTSKLKNMFSIIEDHNDVLIRVLEKKCGEDVHLSPLIERLGMDIIGHSAFGLNCSALEGEHSEFYDVCEHIVDAKFSSVLMALRDTLKNPISIIQVTTNDRRATEFFLKLVADTIRYRKENNVQAKDFLQLLMELMQDDGEKTGLTIEQVTAQAFLFFAAAFETVSKTVNHAMYELSKEPDLQKKVREEAKRALQNNGGKMDYDMFKNCELLDMVVNETLRKYPSVLYLNRVCTKEYQIPDSSVVIEKGTPMIVNVLSLHRDPEYFPNPDSFDPYRFSKENEKNIPPYTYLPFGEGPRFCIGNRLGLLEVKVALMKMILNYEFSLSPMTTEPVLQRMTKHIMFTSEDRVLFRLKKIDVSK